VHGSSGGVIGGRISHEVLYLNFNVSIVTDQSLFVRKIFLYDHESSMVSVGAP
jgi:hypothetical protein